MTPEEKATLFKALSIYFPYGVKFPYHMEGDSNHKECDCVAIIDSLSEDTVEFSYYQGGDTIDWSCPISDVKPYLRPMALMTQEEKEYIQQCIDIVTNENYGDGYSPSAWDSMDDFVKYCGEHHLDFRGLCAKGLATPINNDDTYYMVVPKTVDEAISALDAMLSDEDKDYIKEHGAISMHSDLGRWIRNEWGLWTGSELKTTLEAAGFHHPDDMSHHILSKYVEHLNSGT